MDKPRIIIADTDENYIIPMQMKFAEDHFDQVDLEVITDEEYFLELFSQPQHVDVLIISEELYQYMHRFHNLKHVFLMTERYEEEQATNCEESRIFRIYKYMNEQIHGPECKAEEVFPKHEEDGPKVVLVYSAAGGVGKTTLAMGLCTCLSHAFKRVLYVNAAHLQSFQYWMSDPTPISSPATYAALSMADDQSWAELSPVVRKEHFFYLPAFKAALMSLGLDYSLYLKLVLGAKASGEYDYIVVDVESGFDEYKAQLIDAADKVVVVTTPTAASVFATNTLVSNVNLMQVEKYVFVCNACTPGSEAPVVEPAFQIDEYIDRFEHHDYLKCAELAKDVNIRKLAYLV